MSNHPFKLLINGIDTLQCAYFLEPRGATAIDFVKLAEMKESIRQSKSKNPAPLELAGTGFLLQPYGTSSGYPFVLENEHFKIECGEFNKPNFYVTFRSQALWRQSAWLLHEKFLTWARSAGFTPYKPETLSRVDYCFDYHLPEVDFTEDSFVSRSTKDSQYREAKKVQTFSFGKGDIVLRVYDKVAEIQQQSSKVWFYLLWERDTDVWRIEWQVRKSILKQHDINTFDDLQDQQGDLLRYLSGDHDTLRVPTNDSNSSRWPLHPLWQDLQQQIANLNNLGVHRVVGRPAALDERMERMAISVFGYLKSVAAVRCLQTGRSTFNMDEALRDLSLKMGLHYEKIAWQDDVEKRINKFRHGQW
jgi:hypothetical protein